METKVVNSAAGRPHALGGPLTTNVTREASPSLLLDEVDRRIVKIRPMSTPLDQISRWAATRRSASMIVDYYSVDTPETETRVTADSMMDDDGFAEVALKRASVLSPTETVMMPEVTNSKGDAAVFYVESVGDKTCRLRLIGGNPSDYKVILTDMRVVRMGRAAAELDIQTPQSQAIPVKSTNYCQIFKAQVEQSTMHRMSAKEAGWTLNDQEEVAIIDMRLGMEKCFLFGAKGRFDLGPAQGEVFMTGGIWRQTSREVHYTPGSFDTPKLVELSRAAFTDNAGSARKLLIGGSVLIEELSCIDHVKTVGAAETVTRWGLDFTEIHTKFGRLYVMHSEVFDKCGHEADGMVIDPEYLQKYVHIPFTASPLDLRTSGQRNCEAVVLTEASCLVLRYPEAHLRVIADRSAATAGAAS